MNQMKPSHTPKLIVLASLIIFAISLTNTAFTITDFDGTHKFSALNALLMGSTAFIGGGLLEWFVWLANPIYFIAIIYFLQGNKNAKKISILASFLALSFAFLTKILASESGHQARISERNSGYYLWVLSIVLLTIGINYYMRASKETK
jgi:hypothetical protein